MYPIGAPIVVGRSREAERRLEIIGLLVAGVIGYTVASTQVEHLRTPEQQEAWLAAHSDAYPALVIMADREVLAYGALSPYRVKPAYSTTVEDAVYVKVDQRGKGLGRVMPSPAASSSAGAACGGRRGVCRQLTLYDVPYGRAGHGAWSRPA